MEAVVHAADGAAVAHGAGHPVGRLPVELLGYLKCHGLFALGKYGVDAGVAVIPAVFFYSGLGKVEGILIVAQHRDYLRAEYEKLGQLALGGAAGYKYYGLEPHARRVARTGGSRIAG